MEAHKTTHKGALLLRSSDLQLCVCVCGARHQHTLECFSGVRAKAGVELAREPQFLSGGAVHTRAVIASSPEHNASLKRLGFFYANPLPAVHFTGPTVLKVWESAVLSTTTADGQAAAPIVVLRPCAPTHTCLELACLELAAALKVAHGQSQDPDNVPRATTGSGGMLVARQKTDDTVYALSRDHAVQVAEKKMMAEMTQVRSTKLMLAVQSTERVCWRSGY
eukprot:COSAG01_NODE_514_length_16043_cov_248.614212_13_plen_222_part_00